MSEHSDAEPDDKKNLSAEFRELVHFFLGAAAVYLVITTLIFRTFYIPSSSMEPTLEVGDRVIVLNFAYGWSRHSLPFGLGDMLPAGDGRLLGGAPERGDIVVFRHPRNGRHLIKRVIGLPGDKIAMSGGRLYLNDALVDRRFEGEVRYRHYDSGAVVAANRYVETLPGSDETHLLYELTDLGAFDDDLVFRVPENRIFVMGDNRDRSTDSRSTELSYVPVESLVGRAVTVLFTLKRCKREPGLECPTGRVWRPL